MSAALRFLGMTRGVDVTRARCNFRRFPIAVSCSRPPFVSFGAVILLAIACLCAGLVVGFLGYASLNQHGVLP